MMRRLCRSTDPRIAPKGLFYNSEEEKNVLKHGFCFSLSLSFHFLRLGVGCFRYLILG